MTVPDELIGPRVLLRPFAVCDVPAVLAYASDPEVTRHLQWDAYDDPATAGSFIRSTLNGGETWFARAIVLREKDRRAELGYGLARAYWGCGYATEAAGLLVRFGFERLGLMRIQAACAVENERSMRTLERLGMRREGRLAQYRWKAGAARDLYLYAITRADWDGA
ncbi:MAG: GNAT family N-acetyltransferase [Deltaproteobacteria bacterium]|nr:MAG: GNAT family N-acetyltransferase [Deltaproteobacteria bacterium]